MRYHTTCAKVDPTYRSVFNWKCKNCVKLTVPVQTFFDSVSRSRNDSHHRREKSRDRSRGKEGKARGHQTEPRAGATSSLFGGKKLSQSIDKGAIHKNYEYQTQRAPKKQHKSRYESLFPRNLERSMKYFDESPPRSEAKSLYKPKQLPEEKLPQVDRPSDSTDVSTAILELTKVMMRQNLEPLPKFDGSLDKWPVFLASYNSTKQYFDDEGNIRRLRNSLVDKAFQAVRTHLAFTTDPEVIIESLREIFGRQDGSVRNVVAKIRRITAPDEKDSKSLIKFKRELEEGFTLLKCLKADRYINSPTIVDDVLEKCSREMRKAWGRFANERLNLKPGEAILEDFLKWIKDYTKWIVWDSTETKKQDRAHERSSYRSSNVHVHNIVSDDSAESSHESDSKKPAAKPKVDKSAKSKKARTEGKNRCVYCPKGTHDVSECAEFLKLNVNKRWDCLRQKHICFVCLKKMHKTACPDKKECGVNGCDKFHHKLLHKDVKSESHDEPKSKEETKKEPHMSSTSNDQSDAVHFKIIPVKLYGKDDVGREITVECNAFLDDGSAPSMICAQIVDALNLDGPVEELCLAWTDGSSRTVKNSRRVTLAISGMNSDRRYIMNRVRTVDKLNLPAPKVDVDKLKKLHPYISCLDIQQPLREKPLILIGEEHAFLMSTLDLREGALTKPYAIRTRLGWLIHGKFPGKPALDSNVSFSAFACECKNDQELDQLMNKFFAQEKITHHPKLQSKEAERSLKILQDTCKFDGERYEIGLLWKRDDVKLPDSRPMALRRLQCFENQLSRDKEFAVAMRSKIRENMSKGYLRVLTEEEAKKRTDRTWYLPIFAVMNPHKRKWRIVYDAAASVNGVSLNSVLLKGPDLLNSLCGILWRGREGKIAVAGDIEEMFPQIRIRAEDADSQRVLVKLEPNEPPVELVLDVVSFGSCCSPSSAEFVKNQNANRFEKDYPRAVRSIRKNHFVDDKYDSYNSVEEAIKISNDVRMIHKAGGFKMRNWVSNSTEVMTVLNGEALEQTTVSLNKDNESTDKILGLYWNTELDAFVFNLNLVKIDPQIMNPKRVPTKRESLKVIMSVFDPHGFVSPVTVRGRILMQEMWRAGIDWDEKLNDELAAKWKTWLVELEEVKSVKIPRCFSSILFDAESVQLHTFVDASELAACATSYLRVQQGERIDIAFIGAKCKVAPRNYVSVPRLELEAARVGVCLADSILEEVTVQIHRKFFWTDSRTALAWIQSDHRRYNQFVANRVSRILETTTMAQWNWIAGRRNVADEATKRSTKIDLTPQGRWFSGPEFLLEPEQSWKPIEIQPTTDELRPMFIGVHGTGAIMKFLDVSRYSTWSRAWRVIGWIMRFKCSALKAVERRKSGSDRVLRSKRAPPSNSETQEIPPLTADELRAAEIYLLKMSQCQTFRREFRQLSSGQPIDRGSRLRRLSPYFDKETGLIRLKGRVDAAPHVSEEFKRPIILGRDHVVTDLIINYYHVKYGHQNAETIVNEIRQRFHISELRVAVKKIASKCLICRNKRATPQIPEMSPLPPERLTSFEKPFTYTGMDFFGHFWVTVGRHREKRWGVLFTCLTSRGVHIELVPSLDTDSCIMAIRNFMSRRGVVKIMFSDNGTNLRGAEAELRRAIQELDKSRLQTEGQHPLPQEIRTEWRFITPRAPHQGGAWERLVRSIKTALYATLKERSPKEEVLRNLLIEAENVVNSRPLTYQPLDPETLEALTPNHALQLSGMLITTPGKFEDEEFRRKRWRFAQQLIDEFWRRFVHEILPDMRTRSKWFEDQRPIKVDDIVLMMDESLPRNCWLKGRVTMLHPGQDGKTRSVTVKTQMGIYKRPVARLIVFDVGNSP